LDNSLFPGGPKYEQEGLVFKHPENAILENFFEFINTFFISLL